MTITKEELLVEVKVQPRVVITKEKPQVEIIQVALRKKETQVSRGSFTRLVTRPTRQNKERDTLGK